jgi:hypothetical protein
MTLHARQQRPVAVCFELLERALHVETDAWSQYTVQKIISKIWGRREGGVCFTATGVVAAAEKRLGDCSAHAGIGVRGAGLTYSPWRCSGSSQRHVCGGLLHCCSAPWAQRQQAPFKLKLGRHGMRSNKS